MTEDLAILRALHAIQLDLTTVKLKVERDADLNRQVIDDLRRVVSKHDELLLDQKSGLTFRVASLESSESNRKWGLRILWASVITLLVQALSRLLRFTP